MSIAIRTEDVRAALEPLLGTRFVSSTPLCESAAACLRQFIPARTPLEEMYARVRDCIFGDLYEALGQGMLLTLESGVRLRLRLRDVDTLADEAFGVLLDALNPPSLTMAQLREYALQTGSLNAMRVLLQRYGSAMPALERDMFVRIIRENHPADRYSSWLE